MNTPNNGPIKINFQSSSIPQRTPEELNKRKLTILRELPNAIEKSRVNYASPALQMLEDIVQGSSWLGENTIKVLDTITSDLQTRLSLLSGASTVLLSAAPEELDTAKDDLEEELNKWRNTTEDYIEELHKIIKKIETWIENAPIRLSLHDDLEKEVLNLKLAAEQLTEFTENARKYKMILIQ